MTVLIVDYRICNLGSVRRAIEAVGGKAIISGQGEEIEAADRVILPGVGSFRQGMENLRKLSLIPALQRHVEQGKPLLGLCLGMQLLFARGEEFGSTQGLGFIPGTVKKMEVALPVPHVGWNQIAWARPEPMTEGIPSESYFYFVHSYVCRPERTQDILGVTEYGEAFVSVVQHENVCGLQCHPEKSQQPGLTLLANFLRT
ncbi:MAG: imidazole glycerol phosphate synthase subunit HisH [Acidobacteria bacterium]|nr:imidazole glycerol phosphate synthase subunit HisH [Acidobacteriota bacterium]